LGEVIIAVLLFLAVITVVGHGIWVLLAWLFRLISGSPPAQRPSLPSSIERPPHNDQEALQNVRQRVAHFASTGSLDVATARRLAETIDREAQALRTAEDARASSSWAASEVDRPITVPEASVKPASAATSKVPEPLTAAPRQAAPPKVTPPQSAPVPPTESVTERARAFAASRATAAADAAAETRLDASAPVPRHRVAFSNLLAAFMEEKNIRWGELVGGMLIIGSSVALVISFWAEIAARPLLKFVLFNGVTAALFGIGLYTDRKWKIHTTSQGVLIIAALLVPLNFLAIAAFTQDSPPTDLLSLAGEGLSAIVFSLLVYLAARIVARDAPELFTIGVLIPSLVQLIVRRWAGPALADARQLLLAALPVSAYVMCVAIPIGRYWKEAASSSLSEQAAQRVFTLIGVLSAAACVPLALLGSKLPPITDAIHRLSPVLVWCGLPAVLVGLLFWRRMAARHLVGIQTMGLAIGVLGTAIIVGALVAAWPEPARLLPVAVMVAVMFTWIALAFEIAEAHLPAGLAAAAAWVIGFHLLRGTIDWMLADYQPFHRAVFSLASGNLLIPMVGVFAAIAWLYHRAKRAPDSRVMVGVAAVTSIASLGLVLRFGFGQIGDPGSAFWTLSAYMAVALAVALLADRYWIAGLAWILALAAIAQGVVYRYGAAAELQLPWVATLLSHATLALAVWSIARWRFASRRRFLRAAQQAAGISIAGAAALLLVSLVANASALTAAIYLGWLALLVTALAIVQSSAPLFIVSQVVTLSSIFAAVVTGVEMRTWYTTAAKPWLDPWFLQAQGVALAAYCLVSTTLFAGWKRFAKQFAESSLAAAWPTVERVVAWSLVVLLVLVTGYAALPGVLQELTPLTTARGDGPAMRIVPPLESFEFASIPHAHAGGWGAWVFWGGVVTALGAGLPLGHEKRTRWHALVIALAAICPLLAARWEADVAAASALRWITAGFLLLGSVPLWLRWLPFVEESEKPRWLQELRDLLVALVVLPYAGMGVYVVQAALSRTGAGTATAWLWPEMTIIGCVLAGVALAIPRAFAMFSGWRSNAASVDRFGWKALQDVILVMALAPPAVLLAFVVAAALNQYPLVGPEPTSWFRAIGWDASYGIPLALIAIALVGHAVRDRSSPFAFAAGLLINIVATMVEMIRLVRGGAPLDASAWIVVAQVNAIVAGVVAVAWLAAVEWWQRARNAPGEAHPSWPVLLRTQAGLAAAGCGVFILAAAIKLAVDPVQFGWASAADGLAGWLAAALAAAAALWLSRRELVPQFTVALVALAIIALSALTSTHWDTGNWHAYYTLLFGFCAAEWLVPPATAIVNRLLHSQADLSARPSWSSIEIRLLALAAVLLAMRALDANPLAPWGTIGVLLATGARNVWIAWRENRAGSMWIAAALFNVAASVWWIDRGYRLTGTTQFGQLFEFVYLNMLAAAPTAIVSAVLTIMRDRIDPPARTSWRAVGFHRFAAWATAASLLLVTALGLFADYTGASIEANQAMAWAAWLSALATAIACWWDGSTRWPVAAAYSLGLVGVGIYLDRLNFESPMFHWALANSLAAYSLVAAYFWSRREAIRGQLIRWRVPIAAMTDASGLPASRLSNESGGHGWLVSAGALVAIFVLMLVTWIEISMEMFPMRMIAAYSVGAQGLALALLAGGSVRTPLQYAALVFGALFGVAFGWAWLAPDFPAAWLHRGVAAATALAVATVVYGLGLVKLLRRENEWTRAATRLVPELLFIAAVLVFVVLGSEVLAYARNGEVPVVWPARVAVLGALALMTIAALAAAIVPGRDPLGLSERGRTAYVYAAEVLLALSFVHIRVTVPWLFHGWWLRFWPLVVMAIAFVGAGVGEFFQRRRQTVLGEPLATTGALLPLLPACGFWLVANQVHYSVLLLSVGALYAALAALRRSFAYAVLAAVAANGSLWYLLSTRDGLSLAEHPQLWLIPPALCVLAAGYLNRERLSAEQSAALRYASAIVIYASSTADVFINGVAEAPWLPAVLASLSIAGVFAGIILQVRAFLYLGTSFLVVAILTVIWHAAIEEQRTWILWIAGIVTGTLIIALFGIFEKRRDDVLRLVDRLKQWNA
jgi:hypothetical protein